MTRVLAIDPGLASCGWALLRLMPGQKPQCEACGTWKTSPADGDTPKRVAAIGALFGGMCRGVDLVVVEAWTFQRVRGSERRANSMAGTTIPRVIERIRTVADMRQTPVLEVHQQTAKSAVGVRTKDGVRRAVRLLVEFRDLAMKSQHEADAIAVGIAGWRKWRSEGKREAMG